MLNIEDSIAVIIDIQEKLVRAAGEGSKCAENTAKLAKAANILKIPVVVTEQYPKGLGTTVSKISESLSGENSFKFEKTSFSALAEPQIKEKLQSLNRKQIVLCGIETHICVLQTAAELVKAGYEVYIAKDCTSSRKTDEYKAGLELARQYGIKITCLEIVLFEWLKTSRHPYFKEVQALIK